MPSSDIPKIITRRLASGRQLPRAIFKLSKGWTGIGVSQVPSVPTSGTHLSPTQLADRTIVWLGRVMVMVRRRDYT